MPCYAMENLVPVVDPSSYVHPTAVLIGDVIIGRHCYVGPNAVLRGDFGRITIGDGCNVAGYLRAALFSRPGVQHRIRRSHRSWGCTPRLHHRSERPGGNERGRHGQRPDWRGIPGRRRRVRQVRVRVPRAQSGRRKSCPRTALTRRPRSGVEDQGHRRVPGAGHPQSQVGS